MLLPLSVQTIVAGAAGLTLVACVSGGHSGGGQSPQPSQRVAPVASTVPQASSSGGVAAQSELLRQSWVAYRQRFVQADGRVIDREADDRSISEGQAYTMLRAVLIDDPETFARTLTWAENNLRRRDRSGKLMDQLWVWKWGRNAEGRWGVLDANFASDADIDAITALILAARRWNKPEYLSLARGKLNDLWRLSTVEVRGKRYLLPGPAEAFRKPTTIELNPSYLAPYAFRLFAQVDPNRDWFSLVSSSYEILEKSAAISTVKLPSDWVALDTTTGTFHPLVAPSPILSRYGFDAYRVWWRVALDAAWFQAPEANRYLQTHTQHLQKLWRSQQAIPAQIDLQGQPQVTYEATSQYAMLYAAFRMIDPPIADRLYQQKLLPSYRKGFWDNDSAYYSQNLVWLGLLPAETASSLITSPAGFESNASLNTP